MSEFKGSKGKWKLAFNEYGYYTSVRNEDDTRKICVSRVNNMEESNANLLLISKSKEMLEMLQYFIDNNMMSVTADEMAIKLIKEATTI